MSLLIEVRNLKTNFYTDAGVVRAVNGIDFTIEREKTLGVVGESGCGKTTTGRSILRLIEPTSGDIFFRSKKLAAPGEAYKEINISSATANIMKTLRQEMQIIFQDPYSSLEPRMTVASIVGEPLRVHKVATGSEYEERIKYLLDAVGLSPEHMRRFPHQFSGGQRQRIGIARALALEPQLAVADEPVSALDVSIQAQVINLLQDLQEQFGLTYLFIAHDLSLIKYVSDRVAVMYLGKIVELAATQELFLNPQHPYTEALMSAVPVPDPRYKAEQILLEGDVPSPLNPPSGCYFHPRCIYSRDICKNDEPQYRNIAKEHFAACHFADTLRLRSIRI
ncbi:MAG: ABC transporter ATP-binding protein [Deltaproteobacteria bacterium]|nr:ABC transporter ATP-binding protein [Deltaproteobacteria bacterium]